MAKTSTAKISIAKNTKDTAMSKKELQVELKRIHSRAWHTAFSYAKREGQSLTKAKECARKEAKLASMQFRNLHS
eukprot:2209837-Lingulodinium_polyedra.AAC.1